jgi:CRP-like cAMP-binding protein
MIGEMAFLDGGVRSATLQAKEETEVIEYELGSVEKFLDNQPFWLGLMLKNLIYRLKEANQRLKDVG